MAPAASGATGASAATGPSSMLLVPASITCSATRRAGHALEVSHASAKANARAWYHAQSVAGWCMLSLVAARARQGSVAPQALGVGCPGGEQMRFLPRRCTGREQASKVTMKLAWGAASCCAGDM